jgi:hypothetical protein
MASYFAEDVLEGGISGVTGAYGGEGNCVLAHAPTTKAVTMT